jgi:SAM-dependent methyltransferase
MTTQGIHFWQGIYDSEGRPGWDTGKPTTLLGEALDLCTALGVDPGPAMAVPGCGFGHDAAELARLGYQATGWDFAPSAIQGARERYGDLARWREADWFLDPVPEYNGIFDYTCFVAMEPGRRQAFVDACADRLLPGGLWLGGFFHTVVGESGPPHAVQMEELCAVASPRFEILHLAAATRSHPRRAGREFLVVARRK